MFLVASPRFLTYTYSRFDNKEIEMRAYFFGNMYLSSIQQGIQAAHVTHEMFIKYEDTDDLKKVADKAFLLWAWAVKHKTMILLNGGYADNLRNLINVFDVKENPYPWAFFNEGKDALDGALTCVGIILPEKIYMTAAMIRDDIPALNFLRQQGKWTNEEGEVWEISKWEFDLCKELNNYNLAS